MVYKSNIILETLIFTTWSVTLLNNNMIKLK